MTFRLPQIKHFPSLGLPVDSREHGFYFILFVIISWATPDS